MSGDRKDPPGAGLTRRLPVALNRRTLNVVLLLGSLWTAWLAAAPPQVLAASSPAYPLKLSANRRYLVDQNNTPFLITGDNPHALMGMGSTADAEILFRRSPDFMDSMQSG